MHEPVLGATRSLDVCLLVGFKMSEDKRARTIMNAHEQQKELCGKWG
jgi:hypothetical protein